MPDIAHRRVLDAVIPSPLLNNSNRVEDLGCFDEESCRYFLREVGERVVQTYPFSFGMEEVYSLILERYGYAGLPDATSVLQDLLEDEGTAAGFGDDGDIWRSWRHSWRHRNDDSLNPFIPKVGSFVLQHPTLSHIRRLKARNFLRKADAEAIARRDQRASSQRKRTPLGEISPNQNTPNPESPDTSSTTVKATEDDGSYQLPATTYSHQRTRALLATENGSPSSAVARGQRPSIARELHDSHRASCASSQQELTEVRASTAESGIDPSLLISFEMLSPGWSSTPEQEPSLRGGQGDIFTLQQTGSSRPLALMPHSQVLSGPSPLSLALSSPTRVASSATAPTLVEGSQISGDVLGGVKKVECSSKEGNRGLEQEKLAEKLAEKPREIFRSPPSFARLPASEPSRRRRALNRQAIAIDGEIYHPRSRKRLSHNGFPVDEEGSSEERKVTPGRRSWTPVWQRRDSLNRWLQSMRNVFRSDSNNSQDLQSRRSASHKSQLAAPELPVSQPCPTPDSTYPTTEESRSSYPLGLDGTFDRRPFTSPARMDCNKPLPLSPDEIMRSRSSQPRLAARARGIPSHEQYRAAPTLASSQSTGALAAANAPRGSLNPRVSSRPEVPVRHLLPAGETVHAPWAPATEPTRSPQQQPPPLSAITYSSIARRNPFESIPNTPIEHPGPSAPSSDPLRAIRDLQLSASEGNKQDLGIGPESGAGSFSPPIPITNRRYEAGSADVRTLTPVNKLPTVRRSKSHDVNITTPSPVPGKQKTSLNKFGDFLKNSFLFKPLANAEKLAKRAKEEATEPRPVIVLDPGTQARILVDLELFIITTANDFLIKEANASRLSPEIVMRFQRDWESRGGVPVVEFLYDTMTQFRLIMANYRTVAFCGEFSTNVHARESAIRVWGNIARSVSVYSLCRHDESLRRNVYELTSVLEMLGAGQKTLRALRDLQRKTSKKILDRGVLLADQRRELGPFSSGGGGLYHERDISLSSSSEEFEGIEGVIANMPMPEYPSP